MTNAKVMTQAEIQRMLNDDDALDGLLCSLRSVNEFIAEPSYYHDNQTPEDAA